jgi:hypothetical protein
MAVTETLKADKQAEKVILARNDSAKVSSSGKRKGTRNEQRDQIRHRGS